VGETEAEISNCMWEQTHDSIIANFHMNGFRRRPNANAYYSPSVDRFFAVDGYDPYSALEIAQLLSSKMPGISVVILQATDLVMDNVNCIEHTLEEKNLTVGAANILYGRQTPTLAKIPLGINVVKKVDGPSLDFQDTERYKTFLAFHEYAKFVIHCWHAIKIANAVHNILPMETYASNYIDVPEGMSVPADSVNGSSSISMIRQVGKILYTSNDQQEALDRIKQLWLDNATAAVLPFRRMFYHVMQLPEPLEGKDVGNVDRLTIHSL